MFGKAKVTMREALRTRPDERSRVCNEVNLLELQIILSATTRYEMLNLKPVFCGRNDLSDVYFLPVCVCVFALNSNCITGKKNRQTTLITLKVPASV